MELVYEVVAGVTLTRGNHRISLPRGARLRINPIGHHGFNQRELDRAIRDRKLRALPLGAEAST